MTAPRLLSTNRKTGGLAYVPTCRQYYPELLGTGKLCKNRRQKQNSLKTRYRNMTGYLNLLFRSSSPVSLHRLDNDNMDSLHPRLPLN